MCKADSLAFFFLRKIGLGKDLEIVLHFVLVSKSNVFVNPMPLIIL